MSVAQLYMSGIDYTFNPKRLIFNKVVDINIKNPDGSVEELVDDELYRVVAGLYSAQMLSIVGGSILWHTLHCAQDQRWNSYNRF